MYQIQFRLGLRPRPCSGAYNALSGLLAGFMGATFKGREGVGYGRVKGTVEKREYEGTEDNGSPKILKNTLIAELI